MSSAPKNFQLFYEDGALHATWDAASFIPAGQSVTLQFLDSAGRPLAAQPDVTYSSGRAEIAATLTVGSEFRAQARVGPDSSATQSVVVHNLAPLTGLTADWRLSSLHVNWNMPSQAGSYHYECRVFDAQRDPLDPQPDRQMEGPVGFRIDGATLEDGAAYIIAVRPIWSGSRGPWAQAPAFTVDQSTPDSTTLRKVKKALLDAKAAHSGAFDLTPAIVNEPSVSDLFGSLLGASNNTVHLSGADVTSTSSSVKLTATAKYSFTSAPIYSYFVFTAPQEQLALQLYAVGAGSYTVSQLIERRILPASSYPPESWAGGMSFPNLSFTLDSASRTITFTGEQIPGAWTLHTGLVDLTVDEASPEFRVVAPTQTALAEYHPALKATLHAGTSFPVLLRLPHSSSGWHISLSDTTAIGGLTNLNPLMGGANSGLPEAVIRMGEFQLTYLALDFAPVDPRLWYVAVGLAAGPPDASESDTREWSIANGLVRIRRVEAEVYLTLYESAGLKVSAHGTVSGHLRLSDTVDVVVAVSLPPSPDGLRVSGSVIAENFNLDSLAALMGGSTAPLTGFFSHMGTIGALGLRYISVLINTGNTGRPIRQLSLSFEISNWTIPALSWFRVRQIAVDLDVNFLDTRSVVTGSVSAELLLGGYTFTSLINFTDPDRWSLELQSGVSELPGLNSLNNVVPTDAVPSASIGAFLPQTLEKNTTYSIGAFTLVYNTARGYVEKGSLLLSIDGGWPWLDGVLQLWDINVDLLFSRAAAGADPELNGSISGIISVAGVDLALSARKPVGEENWTFRGELETDLTLDFNAILQSLVPGFRLPQGHGFPTSITFTDASIEVVPATKRLDLEAYSMLDWSIPIGQTTLALTDLGGEVHFPGGAGEKTALVAADFVLGPPDGSTQVLSGFAQVSLGTGSTDFMVLCEVSIDTRPSLAAVADCVIGGRAYASVPAPATLVKPEFVANASVLFNVTQSTLLLTGDYKASAGNAPDRYAKMALLVQPKQPGGPLGFAVAAALGRWTLADISPALSGVDTVLGLTLNKAAIALSTLDAVSDPQLAGTIAALEAGTPVKPGLNFFVELDFTRGLLNNVRSILNLSGPYTIAAQIPSDPSSTITLSASLGYLRLLFLRFERVDLVYTHTPAPAGRKLKLTGTIIARLDRDYPFAGDLRITSTAADFDVATTQSVINPLGIPNLTLAALGFMMHTEFAEDGQASRTSMAFYGSVSFGAGTVLRGTVAFDRGAPALVLVQLLQPSGEPTRLSISALFYTATGLTWPAILDLSLYDGQLSWVPGTQDVTWQAGTYTPGYHARVRAKIFFLPELAFDVALITNAVAPAINGLTATAQFTNATDFDWGFIQFTGTRAHGGPTAGPYVSVDTRRAQRPFGLSAGIVILSTDVGDVDIKVGKDSMTGSFTLPANAGIFAGKQITFTWADKKFTIENWPLDGLSLPKFDLTNLRGSGECSQFIIMELLPIDSKFNLHPSLRISPAAGDKAATLDITIKGTFDLQVTSSAYKNDPVLSADLGSLTWQVPFPTGRSYDWNALARSFVDAIKNGAQNIFDNLIKKPENLAKLSAVAGAKWAIANAVEYLICRGMTQAEAEAAVAAAAGASEGAVSGAACAAGSIAVGGVIASIVGGAVTNQGQAKTPQQPAPAKPVKPTLSFDTDTMTIDWSGSSTTNVTLFGVALQGSASGVLPISAVTGTRTTVPTSQLRSVQTYSATVIAYGPGGQGPASEPGTLFLLPAPRMDALSFSNGELTARWQPLQGATGFEVRVLDERGKALSTAPQIRINGTTATIIGSIFYGGGGFQVQARATATNFLGSWAAALAVTIRMMAATTGVAAGSEGSKLKLEWIQVTGATSYLLEVLGADGQTLSPTIDQLPGANRATISGQGIVDGARLTVVIRAAALNAIGMPYSASITVSILSAPAGIQTVFHNRNEGHDFEEQHIKVTWNPDRATSYTVELRDAQGVAIDGRQAITTIVPAADIPAMGLTDNASYQIAVQGKGANAISSDWTVIPVRTTMLPAPSGLTATNQATSILATWKPASGQVTYEVQVLSHPAGTSGGPPLKPQPHVSYSGTSATIDAKSLTPGELYDVQVRARMTGVIGSWSAPLAFQRFGPPEGLTVIRLGSTLIARWNEARGATGYTLQVLDERGPVVPAPAADLRGSFALIDATRLSRQSVYRVQVCGNFGQGVGPYSEPVLLPVDLGWTEVQPNGPAFAGGVMVSFSGKIWAISGGNSSVYSSPDGVRWSRHRDAPFPARSGAAGVVFGDRIWIFGGASPAQGSGLNDVWSTNDGVNWERVTAAALWAARTGASAVVFQQRMWIMGGTSTLGAYSSGYRDIWSSPDGLSWTQVSGYAPWRARVGACVGVLSGQMFLMGGQTVDGLKALNDVWASSDGSNWTPLPQALWPARSDAASAVVRDILYVFGGRDQGNQYGDLWATRDGSGWAQIDLGSAWMPWRPRSGHGLTNHQNALFLAGGDARSSSSVWRYRPGVPVPANMVPVLARSSVELNERVFSRSAPSARLSQGSMQPGMGTLTTSPSHRIEMLWDPAELSGTAALVVCASSKPLTTLSWQTDNEADVISCAHWTGNGWTPAGAAPIAALVPHQGQYFSMAAVRGGKMRRCSAQAKASVSASLYALAPPGFPIPDGFLPVVASSAEDLIEELFRVKGASPTLRSGTLNTPGCSVTASGAATPFAIMMSLGSDDRRYNVTNTIYACSNVALKQWSWLQEMNQFAGRCEVWADDGWRSVSLRSADGAVAVGGLYFYRVEMVNALVGASFGALITSLDEPATVVFYVAG